VLGFMLCCVGLFAIQLLGRNASTTFQTVGQSIGSST